ncbi:hypothetical protein I3W98_35990, partial [Streptomyces cavourensis]|nr:hypothetical protein [Streptomyces cavourensis]
LTLHRKLRMWLQMGGHCEAGAPLPPAERADVDRITAAARAALGPEAFAEAYAEGTRLPPEEAAHRARTEPTP